MSQAVAVAASAPLIIGRYALFDELAAGGMATVHLGRLLGPEGFGRTVAVKRLHSHYLKDQEFITMFMDEARIVARIRHPNVVPMVDVVQGDKGLFLIMEYVHGESLSRLMRSSRKGSEEIPVRLVAAIMCGVLLGLHAAHETKGPDGQLLGVVHRDVSPQNIIIGADGTARVLDFGIAKAQGRAQVTREGQIKGKLAYMAPEQIRGQVDRRTDVFAAAVVLWELLAGRRLHEGLKDIDIVSRVVRGNFPPPSNFRPGLDPALDEIVMRGLASDPKKRFDSARDLAVELERRVGLATPTEVSIWVERLAQEVLQERADRVYAMELAAADLIADESIPPPPSLALSNEAIPGAFAPRELEPITGTGEAPSSSAVFAHPHGVAPGAPSGPRPQGRLDSTAWAIIGMSAVLALVGLVLGFYALQHRAPRPTPAIPSGSAATLPRTTTPSASPATSAPPVVSAAPEPSASSMMDLPEEPKEAPPAIASAEKPSASAPPPPPATAATAATATGSPAAARPPSGLPPPLPVAAPRKKSAACEPPYTVDDVGHRHYKPECMGLE